jgi:hypothetical protein
LSGSKAFVALTIASAVSVLAVASAFAGDNAMDRSTGGNVMPCSLAGVNPAVHPHIFGNPAIAKSYGFVRSPDGSWHVQNNCLSNLPKDQRY